MQQAIQGIEVTVTNVANQDLKELLEVCLLFPDNRKTHFEGQNVTLLVHPSHIQKANKILGRYNTGIQVTQRLEAEAEATTGPKEKMKVEKMLVDYQRKIIVVMLNGQKNFVPFDNVSSVWEAIREKGPIDPRSLWVMLAQLHQLFPGTDKIEQSIRRDGSLTEQEAGKMIGVLRSLMASAFEGKRVKKGDNLNYYTLYWFPVLVLKELGIITQTPPNRELYLSEEGHNVREWIPLAQSLLEAWSG